MAFAWQEDPSWAAREPLRLAPGDVLVWVAALDDRAADTLRRLLTAQEQVRADRFLRDRDRHRFVVARGILRVLLGRLLGAPAERVAISYADGGKPFLDPPAGERVRFNVSHSDGLAAYAFSAVHEVGIDVEKARDEVRIDDLARRFFSAREQEHLAALPATSRPRAFFRIWAGKEAFIKATGEGLRRSLSAFDVIPRDDGLDLTVPPAEAGRWSIHDLPALEGYAAALVVGGVPARVTYRRAL